MCRSTMCDAATVPTGIVNAVNVFAPKQADRRPGSYFKITLPPLWPE